MEDISIEELLRRLDMTPAELAGRLAYAMNRYKIKRDDDEPTQIQQVHDELKSRLTVPLRSV